MAKVRQCGRKDTHVYAHTWFEAYYNDSGHIKTREFFCRGLKEPLPKESVEDCVEALPQVKGDLVAPEKDMKTGLGLLLREHEYKPADANGGEWCSCQAWGPTMPGYLVMDHSGHLAEVVTEWFDISLKER